MNLAETKALVQDLFKPKAWIYWTDFLLSAFIGWGAFAEVAIAHQTGPWECLAFVIGVFAIYRATLFIHEITHLQRDSIPGFFTAWNLLAGIPVLFPSFMYRGVHIEHHNKKTYGTAHDAEYIAFGAESRLKIVGFLVQPLFVPFILVLRFGVLTPISFLHPWLRSLVVRRFSSLAIDFGPQRKPATGADLVDWHWQEALCFVWVAGLAYAFATQLLPFSLLFQIYELFVALLFVNSVRTLAAHRYNHKNGELTYEEQLVDSVNLEGSFFTVLWAPVGLRFHALHHLFPTMPYHSLGTAHRRLMRDLPLDSAYRSTVEHTMTAALFKLWFHARDSQQPEEDVLPSRLHP